MAYFGYIHHRIPIIITTCMLHLKILHCDGTVDIECSGPVVATVIHAAHLVDVINQL